MIRKIKLSTAKKRAWRAFSLWVRNRGASGNTNVCITCGRRYPITGKGAIQAGHFIPGRTNAILFDPRGVWCQCYGCNVMKNGNMVKYYKFMLKKYGQKVIDELDRLATKSVKYSVSDYLEIESKYKKKLENKDFN